MDRALKATRAYARAIKDMEDAFQSVSHEFLLEHMKRQFATFGRHGGEKWASYASEPKYRAYKAGITGSRKQTPLVWDPGGSQNLLGPSLFSASHPMHVWRANARNATFGTTVEHARDLVVGGIGPFDEPYPGRDIFAHKDAQQRRHIRKLQIFTERKAFGR